LGTPKNISGTQKNFLGTPKNIFGTPKNISGTGSRRLSIPRNGSGGALYQTVCHAMPLSSVSAPCGVRKGRAPGYGGSDGTGFKFFLYPL
jgi:hypothetical protein